MELKRPHPNPLRMSATSFDKQPRNSHPPVPFPPSAANPVGWRLSLRGRRAGFYYRDRRLRPTDAQPALAEGFMAHAHHENELQIPDVATEDKEAIELMRVWLSEAGQSVSLNGPVWDDPAGWGVLLADLARHVANMYGQLEQLDETETLARVREAFESELDSPTEDGDDDEEDLDDEDDEEGDEEDEDEK